MKEVKEGKKWITSPLDIAEEVSESFASKALVAEVNGTPWDMSKPLECDYLKTTKAVTHSGTRVLIFLDMHLKPSLDASSALVHAQQNKRGSTMMHIMEVWG